MKKKELDQIFFESEGDKFFLRNGPRVNHSVFKAVKLIWDTEWAPNVIKGSLEYSFISFQLRKVELFSVELIDFSAPFFQIKIICGKGFYVRSLINDIGKKLNSLSHMVDLRRTLSGAFSIDSSIKIGNAKKKLADNLFKDLINPAQEVLFGFKMVNINDLELKKILVGNPIKVNVEYKEKDKLAFLDRSDNLIAIGILEDGMGARKKVIRNV